MLNKDTKRLYERTDNLEFLKETYITLRYLEDDVTLHFIFSLIGLGSWRKRKIHEEIRCVADNIYRISQSKRDEQKEIKDKFNRETRKILKLNGY